MNLMTLAGHTIDESRLPEAPLVLDVGCRGFDFSQEILRIRPKGYIVALDPDPEIQDPNIKDIQFIKMALVHDDRSSSGYASYSTGEGNMLTDAKSYYDAKMLTVECVNLRELMDKFQIYRWDLVKLDCEGSEFEILNHWPGPIADQISVEFHDGHPQEAKAIANYGEYFSKLWPKLKDYRIVQHEIFKQGAWFGHWDTLLVLDQRATG